MNPVAKRTVCISYLAENFSKNRRGKQKRRDTRSPILVQENKMSRNDKKAPQLNSNETVNPSYEFS